MEQAATVLQEVYFGKEPVAHIQKQLTKVRDKIAFKPVTSTTHQDPEILKFNRLVESFFGFHSFSLYIDPSHEPNAYARNIDTFLTDDEKRSIISSLISSPSGFKYNPAFSNLTLIITINSGLLELTEISDEEVMAVILHEIGHGFFEAVTTNTEITTARRLTNLLTNINYLARDKIKHGKYVTEKMIDDEFSKFSNLINSIKSKVVSIGKGIKHLLFHESMEDNMKKNRIDYTNEKFADTFAAMYGYGEECHSVDIKMMNLVGKNYLGVKEYSHFDEVLKMYKMYIKDLIAYICDLQDEHPAELARIKTSIDYIKRELAKEGIDPKLKKELLYQLNKMYALIDAYKNYPKDKDSIRILRLYHIKLYEKFGGDRREQDTDNDALFKAIDARYDALNKKGDR